MTTTAKKGAYRWIALTVLVLAFSTSFFSRFIWAPVLSTAAGDLGMNMGQAGALMSAFYFGYLILQIPAGVIADKFRCKYFLAGAVAALGIMTFAMQYVTDYSAAYAVRFIGGFFGGAIMAFCSRILSNYFSSKERSIAFGILLGSPSIGTLLANQVGPRVLNASGWRNCFSVCAICIWVVAALVLVVIKEPKREAAPAAAKKASMLDGVKNYFTNPQILILSLAGFLFMAVPPGYSTWANKFMTSGAASATAGLTGVQAGTIITVYSLFSIAGSMTSGLIAKKLKADPKVMCMGVYALMIVSLLFFSFQRTYAGLMIGSIFFGLFSCMSSTHITTWAVNMGGDKYAATTTSTQNLIFQAANVIFPTVAGNIIDANTVDGVVQSYSGVWYLYVGLLAGALVIIAFASHKKAIEAMK